MIIINSFKDMKTTGEEEELHQFANKILNMKRTYYDPDKKFYNLFNDNVVEQAISFGAKKEKEN